MFPKVCNSQNKRELLPPANEVWGKVIFLHLSVILFKGGSASVHAGKTPPTQEQTPPGADTPGADPAGTDTPEEQTPLQEQTPPQEQTPLWAQCMLGDTANKQVVRILLECILVHVICPL